MLYFQIENLALPGQKDELMDKFQKASSEDLTIKLNELTKLDKFSEASEILEENEYALTNLKDAEYVANIYLGARKYEKARDTLTSYSQSVGDEKMSWRTWLIFAEVFQANLDPIKAMACIEQGLALSPNNRLLLKTKAKTLKEDNRHSEAYSMYIDLIENEENVDETIDEKAVLRALCAESCKKLGRFEEAEELLNYVALNSERGRENAELQLALAAHAEGGATKSSLKILKNLINENPKNYQAKFNYSRIETFSEKNQFYEGILKDLSEKGLSLKAQVQLGYAAAKVCEDVGDIAGAFAYLEAAGKSVVEKNKFDFMNENQKFAHIYKMFSSPIPSLSLKDIEHENRKRPIFVLGMPRSGTTLLESIIGAHSDIFPAGELENLGATFSPKKMMMMTNITRENLFEIREIYHAYNAQRILPNSIFVDKMPHNFRWIGFILSAFPDAKVVHIKRDPVAVCFSNFKRYFPAGGLTYSATQIDTARYYKLYKDLMDFWHLRFSGLFYEISYENLTENTEPEIRQLFKFLELPFEEECLEYHKKKRVVLTASQAQVNKGIYKGSSKSWQKYEKYLEPMLNHLRKDGII